MNKLEQVCRKFIDKHNISCPETIVQSDHVIENAYDLIEEICETLGYSE